MKFFGILRMLVAKPCRYFVSKKTPLKVGIYFFIFLAALSTLKVNAEEPKLTYVGNWKLSYQYPSNGDGNLNNNVNHSHMTSINERLFYFAVNSRKRVRILLDTTIAADGYLFLFKIDSPYTTIDTIGSSTSHTLIATDDHAGPVGSYYFGMQPGDIKEGFSFDAFIESEIDAGIYMVLPAARNATTDPYNLIIMNSDLYHPNGYSLNLREFDYSTQFTGGLSGSGDEDNVISRMLIATDNNGIQKFDITEDPVHGSATISGSWWHYTPNDHYFGNDEFTVTAIDNDDNTADQIISVTVNNVDDPTQFISGTTGLGNSNSLITGTLSATDEDGLTDGSYYSVSAQPTDGNATIDASSGDWEYQPNLNYSGNDEFTVTVTDDAGSTSERNIDITVNNPSQFSGDLYGTGDEDNDISGTLIVTDVEELSGDYLAITANSSNGIATIDASSGDWQYTPSDNYFGTDQFTITVTDDLGGTSTQVISITVNSVDDIAQFTGDLNGAGDEDNVISGTLIVSDAEGLSGNYLAITANSSNGIATINAATGEWRYTPNANFNGEDAFTITVTDDLGGTSIQIISVTVNSVDDTTQFSGNTHGIGDEDSDISGTLIATDVEGLTDGNYFTVTLNPFQGAATIDASSGEWQYTPNANFNGEDTFAVTVTDDAGGTSTQVISLTVNAVNDIAQFSGDLNATGDEDSDIGGTLIATDVEGLSGDYFVISVNPLQGTATINSATGEWQYSPNANYFGADQFTLTVTDDLGGISSQLIDISVAAINDAPTITSAEITAATENQLYSYTVTTNDVEADTVSLRANNIPGWLSFDQSTGVLAGTPLHAHVGENAIEIEADDGTVTVSHIFAITVADVNNLPTIELTVNNFIEDAGGLVANMSEAASYVVEDLDGDELTVTFEDGTNSNNHYVLDTAQQKILLTQVAIDIINSGNPLDTISLRVTDNYASQPSTPDESPSSEFDFEFEFPDESMFDLIDGISGVGQGNTFEDSSSSDSNIDEGSSGSSDTSDSEPANISAIALPNVTAVNDLPVINGAPITTVAEDSPYIFTPTASDEDSGNLSFSITGKPAWAEFDPVNGTLSGTPQNDHVGNHNDIVISVTDDTNIVPLNSFSINVTNTNDAPTIGGIPATTVAEDSPYSFTPIGSDVDSNDTLSFSITNKPEWAEFDTTNGALSGIPENDHVGAHNDIVISVTDNTETVALSSFSIEVTNTNDVPVISGIPPTSVLQDENYRFVPQAADVDSSYKLTFSISNKPEWANFDVSNGELKGVPTNNDIGDYSNILISVTDNIIDTPVSLDSFAIEVINVNDKPIIDVIDQQIATENNLFNYSVNASDIDESYNFNFSLIEKPESMIIDSSSGVISWTPGDSIASGDIQVMVQVDDGSGGDNATANQNFIITVTALNDLPVGEVFISGIVAQGELLTASNNLTDADGIGVISYQWQINGQDIDGANQSVYELLQGDINNDITVNASYLDLQGTDESVKSITTTQMRNLALSQLADDIENNTSDHFRAAGIANVSEKNIISINDALLAVGVSSQNQVQQLVNSYITILNFATDNLPGADFPLAEDFSNIGITGVTENAIVLSLLADVIDLAEMSDIESISQLQAMTDAVLATIDQADNSANNLTKVQLDLLGLEGVTENNLSAIHKILAETEEELNQVAVIQLLVTKVIASNIVQEYNADSQNNSSPTVLNYMDIGLDNIDSDNLEKINNAVALLESSALDSIEKIITLLSLDTDADGVEDIIDDFPNNASETLDSDDDTIGDNSDNCPNVANTNQADFDSDLLGDACDPDEDNDGVASAEDAYKFNASYSSDTDGDGMADAFETEYGFDVNNSADKDSDSDGDGVSNLDEFLADTDPRLNPSPGLPQLNIPDDIEVTSTGRLTAVDIGVATAIGVSQTVLQPVASTTGPFSSGRHEVVWSATDALGNQSKAIQVVKIVPLVNLEPSILIAEGGTIEIKAVLSGDAPDYPVEIPYTISGSATRGVDYRVLDDTGLLTIEKGREGSFTIEILPDEELENDETIEITINQLINAELGSVTQQEISIIDGNLPPKILVQVEQAGNLGRVIASDKGRVTLTALISDPNPSDTLSFSWLSSITDLVDIERSLDNSGNNIFVFDPSQLPPNVYTVIAKARDDGNPSSLTEVTTDLRLMQAAPVLSIDVDSDNDGVSDAEEGYGDSDNDGIINYKDNIVESNLMPISDDLTTVLQSQVGTKIVLGEVAFSNAEDTAMVTKQQVINVITELQLSNSNHILDKEYSYPFGLYDFTVSGAIAGDSYYLSLPLEVPFEEGQVLRKYMGPQIGWQNFIENANNSLFSASAINGACPEPGSQLYDSGIKPGDTCIQIYIEDGGPNDFDGVADGIVTDPSGIAVYTNMGSTPSAENSSLEINRKELTVGEKAIITIKAMGEDGSPIEGVNVTATCNYCRGVTIGPISEQGQGIYTAIVSTTKWYSNSSIEVEISNEFGSAKLGPVGLLVKLKKRGGCSIVQGQPADIALFVFLVLLTLFNYRQRRN